MSVAFKPDRYGVQVIHKWTSNSGRWIVFLGTHWQGKFQCWDAGFFNTRHGACQRTHCKTKEEAMIVYDTARTDLAKIKQHAEPEERYTILGPDGRRTH